MTGVLTVTQVNTYIKQIMDGDRFLKSVFVSGEISNYKGNYSSGHLYFSLKDGGGTLRAVMFSSSASRLRFKLRDGMSVIAAGRISVYEATGQYQLYVDSMQPDGIGALALELEQRKRMLEQKGMFDDAHKLPIPEMPARIGVVTSASGSVIQDIKNVVSRRFPLSEIVLYPSAVQGDGAEKQLCAGIEYFDKSHSVDVIIIGRGGGSFEDLYCFNSEALVIAIYACSIPVISAVGHETDFTLCDLVSDMRAPTPSAAAELAVPDRAELMKDIRALLERMRSRAEKLTEASFQDIDRLCDAIQARRPDKRIENETLGIKLLETRIRAAAEGRTQRESLTIDALTNTIQALSPMRLLQKGYSVTTKNGACVRNADELQKGDAVSVRLFGGTAHCIVESTEKAGGDTI